jgi:hypothetical protein
MRSPFHDRTPLIQAIEFGKQSVRGSFQEKTKDLAIAVYNSR